MFAVNNTSAVAAAAHYDYDDGDIDDDNNQKVLYLIAATDTCLALKN